MKEYKNLEEIFSRPVVRISQWEVSLEKYFDLKARTKVRIEAVASCIIHTLTFIIKFTLFFNLRSQIRFLVCPCRKKRHMHLDFIKFQYYKM